MTPNDYENEKIEKMLMCSVCLVSLIPFSPFPPKSPNSLTVEMMRESEPLFNNSHLEVSKSFNMVSKGESMLEKDY